jgi:hypothetical protein
MRTAIRSTVAIVVLLVPLPPQKAGPVHDELPLNLSLFPAPITRNNLALSQALGTIGAYVQEAMFCSASSCAQKTETSLL